jgi:hypothetical protein
MTLILKDRPVGVDKAVDTIQNALYSHLVDNGAWANYESYHRAYRNETNNGVKPEIFSLEGNDYRDAFMSDKFTVTSFFLVANETEVSEDMFTSDISVIFQVDLNKLYPTSPHRFDEEFRTEIVDVFRGLNGTFSFDGAVTDIDSVYAGLDTTKVKLDDTHPRHVVRFELTAKYMHSCGNVFATTGATCNISVTVDAEDETSLGANDGTAEANPTGEQITGQVSYLWDDPLAQTTKIASGLSPNTYTVEVTDLNLGSCTAQGSGTVNEGTGELFSAEFNELNYLSSTDPSFEIGNVSFSMDCWVKATDIDPFHIMGRMGATGDFAYGMTISTSGVTSFISSNGSSLTTSTANLSISAGTYYHIACIYDSVANLWISYIDGVAGTPVNHSGGAFVPSGLEFRISGRNDLDPFNFNGCVDAACVMLRALSAAEIFDLFNDEQTYLERNKTNMLSYWKLNETDTRIDFHGDNNLTNNSFVTRGVGKILQ